ncbi:MAG TPA: Rieske (2Fe-2S) protein [Gemmatimonadales bacterium]|nr:Rieske (2Fe-2S) protein [Gemmatimonadales bacterium]
MAARLDELGLDRTKLVEVDGGRIVVGRTEAGYVACEDRCTSRGGSLADGVLARGTVQCLRCPRHGSRFDVGTGTVRAGPAEQPIATYPVAIRGDDVIVRL